MNFDSQQYKDGPEVRLTDIGSGCLPDPSDVGTLLLRSSEGSILILEQPEDTSASESAGGSDGYPH